MHEPAFFKRGVEIKDAQLSPYPAVKNEVYIP